MLGKEFFDSIDHRTLWSLDPCRSDYSRHGWIFARTRETTLYVQPHISRAGWIGLLSQSARHSGATREGARRALYGMHRCDVVRAATSMTFATGDIVNKWIATLNEDARQIESEAIAKYADSGIIIETRVLEGYPSSALLDVAKNTSSDLIVMGSHGRTGLKRLWLGSVAESVVQEAPIPILIVR